MIEYFLNAASRSATSHCRNVLGLLCCTGKLQVVLNASQKRFLFASPVFSVLRFGLEYIRKSACGGVDGASCSDLFSAQSTSASRCMGCICDEQGLLSIADDIGVLDLSREAEIRSQITSLSK